jgi:Putative prokaryotic signal transducing protein
MADDFIVVRTFSYRQEAELAQGALHAAGIESMLRSDDAGGLRPGMAFSNGVELIVRADDADEAREIIDDEAKRVE